MRRTVFAICMVIGGFAGTGTALAGAPAATTGAAGAVTATGATLNGTVSPNKEDTTYRFEYGTTTSYGSQTTPGTQGGNPTKAVSANVSGLAPSTTYHFRLIATNASGTATGADAQFTTLAAGTAAVTIAASPRRRDVRQAGHDRRPGARATEREGGARADPVPVHGSVQEPRAGHDGRGRQLLLPGDSDAEHALSRDREGTAGHEPGRERHGPYEGRPEARATARRRAGRACASGDRCSRRTTARRCGSSARPLRAGRRSPPRR